MCQLKRISWKTRKKLRIKKKNGTSQEKHSTDSKKKEDIKKNIPESKRKIKYNDSSIEF